MGTDLIASLSSARSERYPTRERLGPPPTGRVPALHVAREFIPWTCLENEGFLSVTEERPRFVAARLRGGCAALEASPEVDMEDKVDVVGVPHSLRNFPELLYNRIVCEAVSSHTPLH